MEAGGREVFDFDKADASGLAVVNLDRTCDQKFSLGAAAATTGHGIVLGTAGKGGFVGLD